MLIIKMIIKNLKIFHQISKSSKIKILTIPKISFNILQKYSIIIKSLMPTSNLENIIKLLLLLSIKVTNLKTKLKKMEAFFT